MVWVFAAPDDQNVTDDVVTAQIARFAHLSAELSAGRTRATAELAFGVGGRLAYCR